MSQTIEVEARGYLTKVKYESLKAFFDKYGTNKFIKNRILIDYSTCIKGADIRDRHLDIRARITNEIPEMIIKVGKWKGSDTRKEISVILQKGQFSNLVQAYAVLGYKKGVLCIRNSLIYFFKNIEFALVEVPSHSYFFEAEICVVSETEVEKAQNDIKNVCKDLNIQLFTDQEWFNYIDVLNKEANKLFDIDIDGDDYFLKRYGI